MCVLCLCVLPTLLDLKGQDRSTGLEAHLVSANSRYIQEQQEQQQVERERDEVQVDGQKDIRGRKQNEWVLGYLKQNHANLL